ncbi:LysR substrate-binding domain-containing protein [Paraburkholderia oxyphila]|uniref:LysR substrate-binding domain-containing protein n=1 Tax=Paraburkholderia oxyphila TaxID=614212 RepID=UPI000483CAC0|nr:LysR substrate-binding domain-containing protein [Paraburkholderia oxyphila]
MNIRQLQYFLAVAQELNFTRASERVNVAQPALSQQIMALEDELGAALFTREKRKVSLTPAGAILVEHAQRVLNAASSAIAAVRAAQRGAAAHLTVGAIYSAIYNFLPNTLREFKSLAETAEVSLQEMTIAQQIAGLKEGTIEVGLVRGHIYDRDIITELLYRELLVVAVPAGSEYDENGPVRVAELAEWPLIAVARGLPRGYADRILEIFEENAFTPNIVKEVYDMHTSICLVAAGMGVAVVPATMTLMNTPGVSFRALGTETQGVSFSVAWRKDSEAQLIPLFRDAARTNAAKLMARRPDLFIHSAPALAV